jgi:hypothetical protein
MIEGSKNIRSIVNKVNNSIKNTEINRNEGVRKHHHKVFAIHETHTIIDPRAMMVHVQYTPFALRAMVGSFWLEHVTGQAVSLFLLVIILR